ncbi:hypothetical protein ACFFRR_001031 [Megaselia abdita]
MHVDDGMASKPGVPFVRKSHLDGVYVTTVKKESGDIHAERWGITVVIRYGIGGTGGFTQPPILERQYPQREQKKRKPWNARKPIKIENGVSTIQIPVDCPYWSHLLYGIEQPEEGRSIFVDSEIDNIQCIVLLESDFSVSIRRLHVEAKLLGPWSYTDLDDWLKNVDPIWTGSDFNEVKE